jgi:hypothetical protein
VSNSATSGVDKVSHLDKGLLALAVPGAERERAAGLCPACEAIG